MSPALLDTAGAQSQLPPGPHATHFPANQGQAPIPCNSSTFLAQNDRVNSYYAMNPSNDVGFRFSAPSMSKSEADTAGFGANHGPSRSRIAKVRKSNINRTMRKFDAAVNRFMPEVDGCGGVSSVDLDRNLGGEVESSFLDEIRKTRLVDENGCVTERDSLSDELVNGIKRLNARGSVKDEACVSSDGRLYNSCSAFGGGSDGDGDRRTVSGLPNEMKKLNIDRSSGNSNGVDLGASRNYNFEFGNRKKESEFVGSSMEDMIANRMRNLDVKGDSGSAREHETKTRNEKAMFGLSSNTGVQPEGKGEKYTPVDVQVPQYQENDGTRVKHQFLFTSKQDSLGTPSAEFNNPSTKGTLFPGFHEKLEFGARRVPVKDSVKRNMKVKAEESMRAQPSAAGNFFLEESSFCYKQEPCTTSEESVYLDENHISNGCQRTQSAYRDTVDEDLNSATELLGNDEGENMKFGKRTEQVSDRGVNKGVGVEVSFEKSISAVKTERFKSANDFSELSVESEEVRSRLNDEARSSRDDKAQFFSASSSELRGGIPFKFSASSSDRVAPGIHSPKKKNRTKVAQDPYRFLKNTILTNASSTIHMPSISRGSAALNTGVHQNEDIFGHYCKERSSLDADKRRHVKHDITSPSATHFAAKEACEKWRSRGNQAYSSGDLDKAEDCYTKGVNSISKSEASRDELRALMLCYSDRAAVRMSLGRFRDAIMDCEAAAQIDPKFFRVQVRKANCYLALGEVAEASPILMKLLQSGTEVCVDRKLIVEASESFQKAQKVSQCIDHSAELLRHKTLKDAELSLQAIEEALAISCYSEKLLQMKAEAFFMMRMYQEVIQLCEQTLKTAEKNFPLLVSYSESSNLDPSEYLKKHSSWVWRYSFIFSSYYNLGKLEEGLDYLERQTDLISVTERYGPQVVESLIPRLVPARELVKRKSAGNSAYQAGKHFEAVEHYTAALACNAESRPFAAICFGNRAAAYQSLGQISDAIADCNLAIALDRNYFKAMSRRATLFEMIRDYEEAVSDLRLLISLLTKQAEEKANQPGATERLVSSQGDLRQAQMRLALMEEQAIKEPPLDFYLLLGVEPSATSAELKKAYRKAALRHHPDKACQLLTRGENVDDGLWKEMSEEVRSEADRLFKMIGEAYSVLSDPPKRFRYEEEVRNALKKPFGLGASRMRSDGHGYQRSSSGRSGREAWASPGNPHNRQYKMSRSSKFY